MEVTPTVWENLGMVHIFFEYISSLQLRILEEINVQRKEMRRAKNAKRSG